MLVCLTMIGKNGWQLACIIRVLGPAAWLVQELHKPELILSGNLLIAAQYLGNRFSRISNHIPCESLRLILETR